MDICDLTVPGAALTLKPEYTLAYNQIVRPHLRWTVTRYFAERWVPTLGLHAEYLRRQPEPPQANTVGPFGHAGKLAGRTAWCIVQLRQVVIWNDHEAIEGEHACQRSLDYLERESGLAPAQVIEILKEPLSRWFIRKQSGQYHYRPATKTPAQDVNTYMVRMDDPLVPADACHLQQQLAAHPVTAADPLERMLQRLDWALGLDWTLPATRALFLAPDLRAPVPAVYYESHPLSVLDLARRLEPDLATSGPKGEKLQRQCEALHQRIINAEDVLGSTYYFRKNWGARLGYGQSWAILLLRDKCYDRPGQPVRETCLLDGYAWLVDRTGVDPKAIQRWLSPNGTHSSSESKGTFLRRLSSQKGSDQRVQHQIWVAVRDPLTADDQERYAALLALKSISADPAAPGIGVVDETEITGQWVVDGNETTSGGVVDGNEITGLGVVDETEQGTGQNQNHAEGGGGQKRIGYWTKPERGESLRESSPDSESHPESPSAIQQLSSSSSSSVGLASHVGPREEEDDNGMGKWNWDDLFRHIRKANPENRRKLRSLLLRIPAIAYVARYLAALADLSIGNPVGLVVANLIEQAESREDEFDAGLPYDGLAAHGRDKVSAMLHLLGNLETSPQAIAFSTSDDDETFEVKEAANRYLDCFELGAQVRQKGKYQATAVQRLRTRILRGLNDLGLPDQVPVRQFEAIGELSPDALPPAAGPEASAEPEPELDERGKPARYSITAQEAWERVYDRVWTRENSTVVSSSTVWKKLAVEKRRLTPARLIRFVVETRRFVVAVTDQAAQAQWGELALELQLELGKLAHASCQVEVSVTSAPPDATVGLAAGEWEGMPPVEIWQTTLRQLQLELSKTAFDSWVRDARLVSSGPGAFVIGVAQAYTRDWLDHRLRGTVQRTLSDVVGRPMEVHFTVSKR